MTEHAGTLASPSLPCHLFLSTSHRFDFINYTVDNAASISSFLNILRGELPAGTESAVDKDAMFYFILLYFGGELMRRINPKIYK